MTDTYLDEVNRVYFCQLPSSGEFIAVEHYDTNYSPTTVYDQAHADVLNERQGITPAQAEAAMMCSMFDNWIKFASISESLAAKS